MAKVFQILNGFCHWDATHVHSSVDSTVGKYASDMVFVEAPDYVFESWGYDKMQEGNARFIQPEAPEHWLYDPATGTFYPDPDNPPEGWTQPDMPEDESAALLAAADERILALEYENLILKEGLS